MYSRITGIVLAGGKSSRMGEDKALLLFNNQTLLSHTVARIGMLFPEVLIAVDRQGRYYISGAREVADVFPERGPLGGIHAGLSAAKNEWAFVTACDMPFWNAEAVDSLMNISRRSFDAVVPRIDDHREPLFALYARGCLPAITDFLKAGYSKISDVYAKLKVRYIDFGINSPSSIYQKAFTNINTKQEFLSLIMPNEIKKKDNL